MEQGWIKIYRAISDHWIFQDDAKFKAWVTILITVNHKPNKILLKDTIIQIERGESANSLETWAKLFGKKWDKSKVRRFFKLLESDSMIELKPERKTTHLRVCNYNTYNPERNASETQVNLKRNASESQVTLNKNDKKENNDKNDKKENIPAVTPKKITTKEKIMQMKIRKTAFVKEIQEYVKTNPHCKPVENKFISYWTEANKSGTKFRRESQSFFDIGKRFGTFLKNNSSGSTSKVEKGLSALEQWGKK